ncbi:MAG: uridine kinase [Thermoflexibacter sp.]|jgi:uridine kinase|nr:uridine kinase [Thermoflexibacter sp.]
MRSTPYIVGVSGGSGSGKTYFLESLLASFTKDEICLVSQDNYYRPIEEQALDENGWENFDLPDSIDYQLYVDHIKNLRQGEEVHKLEYTFNNQTKIPEMLVFKPLPIILVEGIFVFYYKEISKLIDLKVFIEAKDHIRVKRRIIRDNQERGYDLNDVLYRYEHHVMPAYEKYIEPYKNEADFIIPNNNRFDKALEVITTFLKAKIK